MAAPGVVPAEAFPLTPVPRRWERFRALADQKKEALTSALNIQNYHLECNETTSWMREKTKVIESTQGLGNDLAGVMALQRKLSGMERDLEAIQGKVRDLRAEAEKLAAEHPEQAPAILARLSAIEAVWDELCRSLRRREESLGEASKLQGFLRDLAAFQAWLSRTQTAVASEDVPATLAEAERLLSQHESIRKEIAHYGDDYRSTRAVGREVTQGQTDAQHVFLHQRLEALDTGWEELGRMWENRHHLLSQAFAFQLFLRDSKQVEGVLSTQVSSWGGETGDAGGGGGTLVCRRDGGDARSGALRRSTPCRTRRCPARCREPRLPSRSMRTSWPPWRPMGNVSRGW